MVQRHSRRIHDHGDTAAEFHSLFLGVSAYHDLTLRLTTAERSGTPDWKQEKAEVEMRQRRCCPLEKGTRERLVTNAYVEVRQMHGVNVFLRVGDVRGGRRRAQHNDSSWDIIFVYIV